MTDPTPRFATAAEAVDHHLSVGDMSINSLGASVLEESPQLSWPQIYLAVLRAVREVRAEMYLNPRTGIVWVRPRPPRDVALAAWTIANDPLLLRTIERLDEMLDEVLPAAGASKYAVQVMARIVEPMVAIVAAALAEARGEGVAGYVAEHPAVASPGDLPRRVGDPARTNPPPDRRFVR